MGLCQCNRVRAVVVAGNGDNIHNKGGSHQARQQTGFKIKGGLTKRGSRPAAQ
jgi:hypothetical protein